SLFDAVRKMNRTFNRVNLGWDSPPPGFCLGGLQFEPRDVIPRRTSSAASEVAGGNARLRAYQHQCDDETLELSCSWDLFHSGDLFPSSSRDRTRLRFPGTLIQKLR